MIYKYTNKGGNSNVAFYSIKKDSITVEFNGGSMYLYNYTSTSISEIEYMKELAQKGIGLNSYIGRVVKKRFAQKLR